MDWRLSLLKQYANHLGIGKLNVQGSFRLSDDNIPVVWNNFVGVGTVSMRKVGRTFTWKMGTRCLSPGMSKYLSKPDGIRSTGGMRNVAT